ncbi:MAG: hypothetical protein L3J79_01735 [Candidatus Marinimicrobia bacterium]|nr:hypothetical protein [Candidatus Neomarinimicrobiota bacterium]
MIKKVLLLVLALTLAVGVFGQTLEENLGSMLSENATLYLQPVGDAFGAAMNSGWYHRSRVHKMLGFDLSAKMMVAVVPEEGEFFDFQLNENLMTFPLGDLITNPGLTISDIELSFDDIYYGTDTRTPTFFGPADSAGTLAIGDDHLIDLFESHLYDELEPQVGAVVANQLVAAANIPDYVAGMEDLPLPPGIGLPALPLVMPQFALGLPMGIELTVRGFPEQEIPDIGLFSMYGGGVRVNVDQFIPIPLFPVDITAGAFYSQMKIGDILESSNTSVGLQVGKSISLLFFGVGIYADAAYEMSSLSIGYDVDPELGIENDRIQFDMETDPGLRVGAGLHLTIIPLTYFNLHVSQTPNNQVLTAGFGITLR